MVRKIESGKNLFRLQGLPEVIPIPQDEYGVDTDILRETLKNRKLSGKKMPKIMYINPTGMNPTGIIIPLERRKEIYRLACEYNFLILDDDPYHFMHFDDVSDILLLLLLYLVSFSFNHLSSPIIFYDAKILKNNKKIV